MRDSIARALMWILRLLLPARGRHRTAQPASAIERTPPVRPWDKPWTGISSAEAREIFKTEEILQLTPEQRERRWAIAFTECGVDYAYRYPGDHFAELRATA
ncbi:hypothetical protein [Streptomyces turgidiscabies]|uniref:Uncharacterized protein n=1 Tax=Streptomyces turgidiscabies TaxID=85558 RepID=A0ABU0RIN4_9ACTN|nr:hypothetical protein [Streptomyces turgidiscabies]MDQ0931855.1 hypothetical protein [Streptomyces turgidiscabies]